MPVPTMCILRDAERRRVTITASAGKFRPSLADRIVLLAKNKIMRRPKIRA
jgi:hypothetical protein